MFYNTFNNDRYLDAVAVISKHSEDLYLPIEVDTEFQDKHYPFNNNDNRKLTISVQQKPINIPTAAGLLHRYKGVFFRHPDIDTIEHRNVLTEYPTIKYDFCVFDLLVYYGFKVEPVSNVDETIESGEVIHNLYVHLYGFHLVSDITRLFKGKWHDLIMSRILTVDHPNGSITHGRRLYCYNDRSYKHRDVIDTCQLVFICEKCYRIFIKIFDNCALQGSISYQTLCDNTKVKLAYKDNMTTEQKRHMYNTANELPDDLVNYALGDLYNYDARQGHMKHLQELYKLLDIQEFYDGTKGTIGRCVFYILEGVMLKRFKLKKDEQLKELVSQASHTSLIENRSSTQLYLAKTNGGRCYNNRPTEPSIKDIIIDIDIKGCYAKGLEIQDYPIGLPVIIEYNRRSNINQYNTLREFLKNYEKELVDGLWYCRISTTKPLTFEQDYFLSWLPTKDVLKILTTDYEKEVDGSDPTDNDHTRIYSNEIHLGVLQADGLEWIKHCLCKQEREELLDNTEVITAGFYPKSLECVDLEEFKHESEKQNGKNTCKVQMEKTRQVVIKKELRENHVWHRANIGELLIRRLSELRKKYDKNDPDQSAMNTFIKLIINTTYGDLVSPYFYLANTIVGNNVTARARAMAWYMEKALHGIQTVTDGCAFQLNKVVKSRYALTNAKYFQLKNGGSQKDLWFGCLMKRKRKIEEIDKLEEEIPEINELVSTHIKKTFSKVKVVHQYEVEVRGIYTGIATHGPSNYQLYRKEDIMKTKMRSYKNIEYINYDINEYCSKGAFSRTVRWLDNIYKQPTKISRGEPFVEEVIIKTNQYNKQKERLSQLDIGIGDVDHRVRIISEFSLSMFLYKSHTQYISWKKEHDHLKMCYKQSYEAEFIKPTGELNYMDMIKNIQQKIRTGMNRFYKRRKHNLDHPKKEKVEQIEKYIQENYKKNNIHNVVL